MKENSIGKNALFNVIYKVTNIVFPLVTSIYVSHILGASGIGKVGIAQNIVQYFVLLAPLGLLNYGTREIAKIKTDNKLENILFTELFGINTISTILFSAIYYILVFSSKRFQADIYLYTIVGIQIIFNIFNVEWYYQGHEKFKFISIRNVAIKVSSLICILIFVKTKDDYIIYALIYALGIASNHLLNIINLRKSGISLQTSKICMAKHIKPVLILFCSTLAIELYTLLDTTMLGVLCTEKVVGYYANSIKLIRVIVGLIAAIGGVLLPRLSYYKQNGKIKECESIISKVINIMLFFCIPCALGVFAIAKELVVIMFGYSFEPAYITLRIGSVLVFFLGFSNLFGTQILLTFNDEKKLFLSTCVGAISNIIMNSILIPVLEQNGAMIASIVSELLVLILTYYYARKHLKIVIEIRTLFKNIVSGGIMFLFIEILYCITSNIYTKLAMSILVGACIYFLINVFLKNETLKDIFSIFKKV